MLNTAFANGVGSTGIFYNTNRPFEIGYLISLFRAVIKYETDSSNVNAFHKLADQIRDEFPHKAVSRHVVLHLLFPDYFEPIASEDHKKKILSSFTNRAGGEADLDLALLNIRRSFEAQQDQGEFDFYQEDIRATWDSTTDGERHDVDRVRQTIETMYPNSGARHLCLRTLADSVKLANSIHPGSWSIALKSNEIYLNVGKPFVLNFRKGVLQPLVNVDALADEWESLTEQQGVTLRSDYVFTSVPGTVSAKTLSIPVENLVNVLPVVLPVHQAIVRHLAEGVQTRLQPYKGHYPSVVEYLRQELGEELPDPEYGLVEPEPPAPRNGGTLFHSTWLVQANPEIWSLSDDLKKRAPGYEDTWSVTRYQNDMKVGDRLLVWQSGQDAGLYAIAELTGGPFQRPQSGLLPDNQDPSDLEWAISFKYTKILDEPVLRTELLVHPILKKLQVIGAPQGRNFKVTPEEWAALYELLGKSLERPTIEDLAFETHMDVAELSELEEILRDKKQIVLEGPPGSGKTFVADLLARYLTGNPLNGDHDEHVEIVQFHQSYGYEDFVQGIRPVSVDGSLRYEVRAGIFTQFCARAKANPDQNFVLIIDEINRGNISRIFGELMLLLEYRDKSVRLPYGAGEGTEDGRLSIPSNLYLIGTMNSTDRSLALIDYALRRRFYYYRLLPTYEGAAPVFARWLARQDIDESIRAHRLALFTALNIEVQRQLTVDFQVGHSYLMRDDIGTESGLKRVWQRAIMPLLYEYFHNTKGAEATLRLFTVERLVPTEVDFVTPVPFTEDA